MKGIKLVSLLVVFALSQMIFAQSADPPTIAFMSFGTSPAPWSVTERAILDILRLDGYLSEDEYAQIETRGDIEGEAVQVVALDAGWEYNQLGIMVEHALDRGADVLVAFTTPVAQSAINATADMEEPPALIFASVRHPIAAGLADAPCVKPSHVTGIELLAPYEQLVSLVKQQQPDIAALGVIFSSDQIAGVEGSRQLVELGEAQGITMLEGAVTQPIDFIAAVDGLVSRGAEALIPTIDTITARGLNAIVATASENLLPVYYPSLGGISSGAMISAGTFRQVEQGVNIGRLISAYLSGELDIATTAVSAIGGDGIGVNLNVAEALEIEISADIMSQADFGIYEDQTLFGERMAASIASDEELTSVGSSDEDVRAYLDSLHCTDEMIAEQEAALE